MPNNNNKHTYAERHCRQSFLCDHCCLKYSWYQPPFLPKRNTNPYIRSGCFWGLETRNRKRKASQGKLSSGEIQSSSSTTTKKNVFCFCVSRRIPTLSLFPLAPLYSYGDLTFCAVCWRKKSGELIFHCFHFSRSGRKFAIFKVGSSTISSYLFCSLFSESADLKRYNPPRVWISLLLLLLLICCLLLSVIKLRVDALCTTICYTHIRVCWRAWWAWIITCNHIITIFFVGYICSRQKQKQRRQLLVTTSC